VEKQGSRLADGDGDDLGGLVRVSKDLIGDKRRLVEHGPCEGNDQKSVGEG